MVVNIQVGSYCAKIAPKFWSSVTGSRDLGCSSTLILIPFPEICEVTEQNVMLGLYWTVGSYRLPFLISSRMNPKKAVGSQDCPEVGKMDLQGMSSGRAAPVGQWPFVRASGRAKCAGSCLQHVIAPALEKNNFSLFFFQNAALLLVHSVLFDSLPWWALNSGGRREFKKSVADSHFWNSQFKISWFPISAVAWVFGGSDWGSQQVTPLFGCSFGQSRTSSSGFISLGVCILLLETAW